MNELFIALGAVALVLIVAALFRKKAGKGGGMERGGDINKPK